MPGRSGGHNAKPAWLKIAEGNRSKTAIPPPLSAEGDLPPPPKHLSKEQKACWRRIVAALPDGVLVTADAATVERGAVSWAAYQEATRVLNEDGFTVVGERGGESVNPMFTIRSVAAKELAQACAELGLSPLARSRLGALEAQRVKADPMDVLIRGSRGDAWAGVTIEAEVEKQAG